MSVPPARARAADAPRERAKARGRCRAAGAGRVQTPAQRHVGPAQARLQRGARRGDHASGQRHHLFCVSRGEEGRRGGRDRERQR